MNDRRLRERSPGLPLPDNCGAASKPVNEMVYSVILDRGAQATLIGSSDRQSELEMIVTFEKEAQSFLSSIIIDSSTLTLDVTAEDWFDRDELDRDITPLFEQQAAETIVNAVCTQTATGSRNCLKSQGSVMASEGHVGLSNEKTKERTVGAFKVALSCLKTDDRTAYVIHVYSNTYGTSPYLQRTNLGFGGHRRGGRKNFLERLGFAFSPTCNILNEGECYCRVIEEVDQGDRFEGGIEEMLRIKAIHERFEKFADSLEDIYNRMREIDQKLFHAGFELPWEKLELAPVVFGKDEKVYVKGMVYDFYTDIREITRTAKNEVFVIDAYTNEEVLELYFEKLPTTIRMRILTNKPEGNFLAVARKFKQKAGAVFEVRKSPDCHDRLFFVDNACWVMGQSIKDAARKPTYLVRIESHDLFRKVFEDLWKNATSLL